MRAVIYARYSAGRNQTDQSIEGQVRICTDYCASHNLEVIEIYADRHITGKTDERKEFQRMIQDAKQHRFDALVVYRTDRLSRDKYDAVIYKRELKKAGVQIHYAAEAIPEGPEGIILESLMEGLAEYYSAELSQKIKRGMHESALKCRALGKCVPLGYKVGPDKTYVIDERGAEAVRIIFEMYLAGRSQVDIIKLLNSKGYKTATGENFNKNSIPRILANEKYIGVYEAAGVRIENGLPAIIDEETFMLAQRRRSQAHSGRPRRPTEAPYLLSNKLLCAYCHKPLTGVSGTSKTGAKHFYYYCPTARRKAGCHKKHIKRDEIEELVLDLTVKYLLAPGVLELCVSKMLAIQAQNDDRGQKIKSLNKLLADNKKAQNGLLDALQSGLGTDPILRRLSELDAEAKKLEAEITYQKTKQFGLTEEQMLFFLEKLVTEPSEDPEAYKSKILKAFVNSIIISDDKLEIFYNLTDENDAGRALEYCLQGVRPAPLKVDLPSPAVEQVKLFIAGSNIKLDYMLA